MHDVDVVAYIARTIQRNLLLTTADVCSTRVAKICHCFTTNNTC